MTPVRGSGTCGATSTPATVRRRSGWRWSRSSTGTEVFIIANADTCMTRPNSDLIAEFYPGVEVRGDVGEHDTLLSIDKARRLLGYQPAHSWRDATSS